MTAPHGAVSVHPSEDAGVPEVGALWHTTVAGRLHSLFGCYCTDPAKVAFVEELHRALASVSPVPAPTPEAVQDALKVATRECRLYQRDLEDAETATDPAIRKDEVVYRARLAVYETIVAALNALATPQPPREGEIHPDTALFDLIEGQRGTLRPEIGGWVYGWGFSTHRPNCYFHAATVREVLRAAVGTLPTPEGWTHA